MCRHCLSRSTSTISLFSRQTIAMIGHCPSLCCQQATLGPCISCWLCMNVHVNSMVTRSRIGSYCISLCIKFPIYDFVDRSQLVEHAVVFVKIPRGFVIPNSIPFNGNKSIVAYTCRLNPPTIPSYRIGTIQYIAPLGPLMLLTPLVFRFLTRKCCPPMSTQLYISILAALRVVIIIHLNI
ncbi:hypothetical protein F4801DRAFT_571497 [Xylaria longipes]|nr:hypothetical protein F4801DRAFT_571497 [Xylaria longipes]